MRTVVVSAYIGPLPGYFPLWLRSASHNPSVDFIVATDQPPPAPLPGNVRFASTTLSELAQIFGDHIDGPVALSQPYKLCDFKPLFWLLVPDLHGYDYWGFCDLDLVFGDIGQIIAQKAGQYDSLFSEGHLRLFRNTPDMRALFREVQDPVSWKTMLAQPEIYGLDEHHGINRILHDGTYSWFADPRMIADIDPGFRQMRRAPYRSNYRHQNFYWHDGRVYREWWAGGERNEEEFLYCHVQKRRMTMVTGCTTAPGFDIGPAAFVPRGTGGKRGRQEIATANPRHWPNRRELYLLAREARRRLLGRPPPFPALDRPDANGLG